MENEAISTIVSICAVSSARASELLDAASGSVERAVEIHLNLHHPLQSQQQRSEITTPTLKTTHEENNSKTSLSNRKKKSQSTTLDAYFSPQSPQEKKRPKTEFPTDTIDIVDDSKSAETHANMPSASTNAKPVFAAGLETKTACKIPHITSLPYSLLAAALAEMTATTKRTIKTNVLIQLFIEIIRSAGGIHSETNRDQDALVLTRAMDLILGKLSSSSSSSLATTETNGTVLQVSGSAVSTAVQTVTGVSRQELGNAYRKSGDLGDVAASLFVSTRQKQFFSFVKPQASLSILDVHEQLKAIANVSAGKGSQKERSGLLVKLMRRASDKEELRFLVRSLLGNMRLGATIKTLIVALATAVEQVRRDTTINFVALPDPSKSLEKVFNLCPRLDKINAALLTGGVPYAVKHCSIEMGYPIQPMLADPLHSFSEIQSFLTASQGTPLQAVAEYKYDGVRCQAHWDGQTMKLYSRNMLENTAQYPDAIQYILGAQLEDVSSFIIDAEIVGVVADGKCSDGFRLLPFQDLSTRRGTKLSEDPGRVAVQVYAFDLMLLNNQSLLDNSLHERQALLKKHFRTMPGFAFAKSTAVVGYQEAALQATLQQAIDEGAEGLMLKLAGDGEDSTVYESGTRSKTWKKIKKDYLGGFADTIDVVPIGAWYGTGRKAQKGFLSPVLFAVYDEEEGVYRSISRCMSFSDAMYSAMREFYFRGTPYPSTVGIETPTPLEADDQGEEKSVALAGDEGDDEDDHGNDEVVQGTSVEEPNMPDERVNCFPCRPPSSVIVTNETPSVWFKPLEVFEISFADMSLSKAHTAAAGLIDDEQGRGVALRFPRFKRRRPDKLVEQATTCTVIARLFSQQSKMKKSSD
jgi:DNA ligase-1